jgi:hypothetical protein
MAADCIRRGLDALTAEPAAAADAPPGSCQCADPTVICPVHPRGPAAAEPVGGPDPLARSMALAMVIQRQVEHGKQMDETLARVIRLEQIMLVIAPETCAKHDLMPF